MVYLETGCFSWNITCGFGRYLNELAKCSSYDGIICFQSEAENVPIFDKRRIIGLSDINYRNELQKFIYSCEEGDIIHFPMNTIIPVDIPLYIKVVYTIHDLTPLVMRRLFTGGYKTGNSLSDGTLLNVCELKDNISNSLKRANRIVAISNSTLNDIASYFSISKERINLIYNTLSNKFDKIPDESIGILKKHLHIENKKVFLTTFSKSPTKNSFRTILAFIIYSVLYDRNSILILTGKQSWKKNVLFFPFLLMHKILFSGYLSDEELCEYYNIADCLLYLSLYEGFGFPPLEAMACKTYVISSNNSSLKELLNGYAVLLNEPRNIRAIVNALKDFSQRGMNDEYLKEQAYKYAHSFVTNDFTKKYENLFNELKS